MVFKPHFGVLSPDPAPLHTSVMKMMQWTDSTSAKAEQSFGISGRVVRNVHNLSSASEGGQTAHELSSIGEAGHRQGQFLHILLDHLQVLLLPVFAHQFPHRKSPQESTRSFSGEKKVQAAVEAELSREYLEAACFSLQIHWKQML